MNWIKLILIVIVITAFLVISADPINEFLLALDWDSLTDPLVAIGAVINVFIVTFDTATSTYPLMIQTIVLFAGYGIVLMVVDKFMKGVKK